MSAKHDWSEADIAHITCYRTRGPIRVDGHLDEAAWQRAPKSPRFVDMASGAPGFFDTRVATLWDDENFYVGFWIEEPFVEARHTERDAIIFQENDVEVFIDGGDCYYEFEINALNTIYEILFVWRDAYTRGSRFDVPEFDLLSRKAVTFGGDYDRRPESFWWGTHPRGLRWAFLDWDLPGVRSAVQVDGTINDNTTVGSGLVCRDRVSVGGDDVAGERPLAAAAGRRHLAHVLRPLREAAGRRRRDPAAPGVGAEQPRRVRHASAGSVVVCAFFGEVRRGSVNRRSAMSAKER